MLDMILLVLATCCDSFFMSVAYGVEGIRIPMKSILVIAFCGTLFLGISMMLAGIISQMISPMIGKWISFSILLVLGCTNLFQARVKHYVKQQKQKPLIIKFQGISFVIDIFLDEKEADQDHSKYLSMKEAFYLGVALSIDSLASGLAYGIGITDVKLVLLVSFIMGITIILLGSLLGTRIMNHIKQDVSWISGCLLIILAFLRFN